MNTTEIAAMIRRAPVLSSEFQDAAETLRAHATAKAATGAPVALEDHLYACMLGATRAARHAQDACNRHARMAAAAAADMATAHGGIAHGFGWTPRENMTGINTESPAHKIESARIACEALRHAVDLFADLTDRIAATPEDVKRHAEEQRARRIDAWLAKPVRETRAAAKAAGIKVGTDRVDIATALAAAGVDP